MFIYTATPEEWKDIQTKSFFHDSRFHQEGFIHCSYPGQTLRVLNKHYRGHSAVMLLVIDPERLSSPWRSEDLKNKGESFPHVYGDINLDAVAEVHEIKKERDGEFVENKALNKLTERYPTPV